MNPAGPRSPSPSVDIFCTVIDNYGDIGVCWRLARQLHGEYGCALRLWVDDLASFARLCPALDTALACQRVEGIEVRHWSQPFPPDFEAADLVIEGFACRLPERVLEAMAARKAQPTWVNLDYLSAEEWVEGCHGLMSRHPRLPLEQCFFFPGFTAHTGGLLREGGLLSRRDRFQADAGAQYAFWEGLGISPQAEEMRVSLFSYETPALARLLDVWSKASTPLLCLVPEGRALNEVQQWLGHALPAGQCAERASLRLHALPFLAHDDYDRLLWACDLNIVRGEDSFVRALWAGRPLLWHIYAQEEDAHWVKLQAFLQRYRAGMPADAAAALDGLWSRFNGGSDAGAAWNEVRTHLPVIRAHAHAWTAKLEQQQDLAAHLVKLHQERVQSRVS